MPFPKKERDEGATEARLQVLEEKEHATQEKIQTLEAVLKNVKERGKKEQRFTLLKAVIRAVLFTTPLWLLFVLSLETDLTLYLSAWGIALILILYFGTVALYFYFRYLRPEAHG